MINCNELMNNDIYMNMINQNAMYIRNIAKGRNIRLIDKRHQKGERAGEKKEEHAVKIHPARIFKAEKEPLFAR